MAINSWLTVGAEFSSKGRMFHARTTFVSNQADYPTSRKVDIFLKFIYLITWTCTSLAELGNIALTHKVIISQLIQQKTYGLIYNSLRSKLTQPKCKNDIISKVSFFHKINQMRKNEVILSKMICNITSIHSFLFQNHLTHT